MKPVKQFLPILFLIIAYSTFGQTLEKQKATDKFSKTQDSIIECITLEDMLQQADARDKRYEVNRKSKNNEINSIPKDTKNNNPKLETLLPNPDSNFVFSGDYDDLLTLEMASRITDFEPSKARKTHILKGMTGEILRYNWENGREVVKEKSASNRKRVTYSRSDIVQIKWVDFEADMDSFLDFIGLEHHPELSKINGVGESAYWNSKQNHLEVYAKGISFTVEVDISNDDTLDKEKTIALAKLIIEERIK